MNFRLFCFTASVMFFVWSFTIVFPVNAQESAKDIDLRLYSAPEQAGDTFDVGVFVYYDGGEAINGIGHYVYYDPGVVEPVQFSDGSYVLHLIEGNMFLEAYDISNPTGGTHVSIDCGGCCFGY